MPMRREQVAAALRNWQDKADLRGRFERATSLDPQEQDFADIAIEGIASLAPGVGPAFAARDVERARRANDPAGMAMASMGAIPGGRLAKLLKGFDPTQLELDVYHGTPHRFEPTEANPLGEFDASKIGTGEGAQAYGHGVYLAESPNVAKSYKTALQGGPLGVDVMNATQKALGVTYDEAASSSAFIDGVRKVAGQDEESVRNAIIKASERMAKSKWPGEQKLSNRVRAFADNPAVIKAINEEAAGTLYKADLPDEMIDRMLDWDKPLSEQHPEVQRIIGEEIKRIGGSAHTGEQAYRQLMFEARMQGKKSGSNVMRNNLEANEASRRLQELGIPGIKYLDAGSRGQGGSGTRNFVVFPGEEKKVRILERK